MIMLRNIMEGKYSFNSPEWESITGKRNNIYVHHSTLTLTFALFSPICAEAPKDLIRKLLVVDPSKRLNVTEALRHEFFQITVSVCLSLSLHPCY